MKAGLQRRAEQRGKLSGGLPPFGARWVGPKFEKTLEWIPDQVTVVREVFDSFVNGMSQRAIARALAERGIPTGNGGVWRQATVRHVLTNPVYVGKIRHLGEIYDGAQDAIITEGLFEAAQERIRAAARTTGHGGGHGSRAATSLPRVCSGACAVAARSTTARPPPSSGGSDDGAEPVSIAERTSEQPQHWAVGRRIQLARGTRSSASAGQRIWPLRKRPIGRWSCTVAVRASTATIVA